MNHTKMNGDLNWNDGDEIDVCLGGILLEISSIHNRTKNPNLYHVLIMQTGVERWKSI